MTRGRKLTKTQVRSIRALIRSQIYTLQEIADRYNVHVATIWDIKTYRTWKNI